MLGMPAERHLAFGSNSSDPAMRDFRMTSHLARYSGVSFGAFSGRPARPSRTSTGRGGGTAPAVVLAAGGGAAARPPLAWPNGSIGEYTPVKSGGAVPCARSDAVDTNSRHRSTDEHTATGFDMMFVLAEAQASALRGSSLRSTESRVITAPPAAPAPRPRCHPRA